jgi:molybdate transport system permease protein
MDWTAIALSLKLAVLTTIILFFIGLPLGYWLAASKWRGKIVIEAIVALPLVLPPTVLGFYLLLALGPRSPVGKLYETATGELLPFSFQGLLIASVLYSMPFTVQPFSAAFAAVDRRFVEASWCLGEGRLATFFRVVLPLSWPGVLTGMILSFAHTIGEFGVVLMVGGNLPGETRTISISIYDSMQALDYAAAGKTALMLLAFSFSVLIITYTLQRNVWAIWPRKS